MNIGARGNHGQSRAFLDRNHGEDSHDVVTGHERTDMLESLVGVHYAREIDVRARILNELRLGRLGDRNREGDRRHQVAVTLCAGGGQVVMLRKVRATARANSRIFSRPTR